MIADKTPEYISAVKDWIPVPLINIIKNIFKIGVLFEGNYSSWAQAKADSTGYNTADILKRVRDASLKVKHGDAVFERDSVCFYQEDYCWSFLAALLWSVSVSGNRINLIDYGGALGSTYYQYRRLFNHLNEITWSIVEQDHFVECGKEFFEDEELKFYYSINECIEKHSPSTILLGSVIQYHEKPYDLLNNVIDRGFPIIIIDRTPFIEGCNDRLTVQKVPAEIYPASYPAWLLSLDKFTNFMSEHYELITDTTNKDKFNVPVSFKGFIYKRR